MRFRLLMLFIAFGCYASTLEAMKVCHQGDGVPGITTTGNVADDVNTSFPPSKTQEGDVHSNTSGNLSDIVGTIIKGTAVVSTKSGTYPVCVNGMLKKILNDETTQGAHPVTDLLGEKLDYCRNNSFSKRTYNIHFILRTSGKEVYEIDIRPTARIR